MIRLMRVAAALASFLRLFSVTFLAPVPVALLYDRADADVFAIQMPFTVIAFLLAGLITFLVSGVLSILSRDTADGMAEREGYLATGLGWLAMPACAMLPFLFTGMLHSPLDAYFEAMSGLTTTGFTVIPGSLEAIQPSLHFWRAFLQWLGGVGIIVVGIALLSQLSGGSFQLFQAEASAHASQRLKPKMASTARTLLGLYASLSALFVGLLTMAMVNAGLPGKQAFFDAVVHVFTSFSTGGFSSHTSSVAFFGDPWVESILTLVMLLGATHFSVLISLRKGNLRQAFKDPEWRFFLGLCAMGVTTVILTLVVHETPWRQAIRQGVFTATSLNTSTGLAIVDFSTWPVAAVFVLLLLMFLGGSSGSTAAGLKAFRIMLMAKIVARQLRLLVHPRAVIPIRINGRTVTEAGIATATSFMFTYVALWGAGALLLATFERDFTALEAAAGSAAALGNVGLAFGPLGPSGAAALLTVPTKLVFIILMWFGRLEIFTALLLFYPSSWRN